MQQKAVNTLFPNLSPTAPHSFSSLCRGTAAAILENVDLLHKILCKAGIPSRPYTFKSAEALLDMGEEKKLQVLENLKQWNQFFSAASIHPEMNFLEETQMVEKAIHQFSFKLKNHKWDTTAEEQILEVYNSEGVQLYRSLGFFKTCGYSLLDLCVNEWYVLWDRPQRVVQQMNEVVAGVLSGSKKDNAVCIAPHLVLETYDDGCTQPFSPRAVFVNFKNIYPLYSPQDQVSGFIVTSTAKVISEGDESLKIDFI